MCNRNNIGLIYFRLGRSELHWLFEIFNKDDCDHPAGTSKDSDIYDFSKVPDIENSMVVNGKIYIFKHPAYLSKDIWEI